MSDSESEKPFCPCPACAIEGVKYLVWKFWESSATKSPRPKHHIDHSTTAVTPVHESGKPTSKGNKEQVLNPGTDASSQDSTKGIFRNTPKKGPSKPRAGTPIKPAPKEPSTKNNSNTTVTPVAPTKVPVESAPKIAPKHNPNFPVTPIQGQLKLKATLDGFTSSTGHNSGPDVSHTQDPGNPGSRPGSIKERAFDSSAGTPINTTQKSRDPQIKTEMTADPEPIAKPTKDECIARLQKHITKEKEDLANSFFKKGVTEFGDGAEKMVSSLMDAGCIKKEIAQDLSVLTLYNLVILIGLALS